MLFLNPPHEVTDEDKFDAIVEAFRLNADVPPVAANGINAVCGSHRIAAHQHAYDCWSKSCPGWEQSNEPILRCIEVTDDEYAAACEYLGVDDLDQVGDLNAVCDAIYQTTDDPELKQALEDQRD